LVDCWCYWTRCRKNISASEGRSRAG